MIFNNHSNLEGQHAFLGASKYHWINYDETKVADAYSKFLATQRGTVLHDFACQCITLGQKLPKSQKTLNMYVNDAISFRMVPEQILFYSENCFGTADTIVFRNGTLRIHDLKTGVVPAHMEQLEIYAALFCLEYKVKPSEIEMELRLYQNNEILYHTPTAEDPLYAVINEPNSTMQRLIRKLNLLDVIDEQSGSGKLDLIIQLPYVIKTEARRQQAENRRKDIENQLSGSKYGIAYTDGTEHITQLNRSVNNNLMSQIEYLTSMLYSQLGITQSILDGTADEKTMLNYNNRTIEPIISAIVDEMKRKFLTKTARSQHQSISFFRDPFKLVPVNDIAEIADKFTRNEIMTSNEIRQVVGMKPSEDPRADELRNKNLSAPSGSNQQSEEMPIAEVDSIRDSVSDLDDKVFTPTAFSMIPLMVKLRRSLLSTVTSVLCPFTPISFSRLDLMCCMDVFAR